MDNVNILFMNEAQELIQFWFSNDNLWFNASNEDDLMIIHKYEGLLDNVDKDFNEILLNTNNKIKLGLILLYDQIGRHICRVHKNPHIYYFNKVYVIAKSIIENNEFLESYKPEERVFILLVYRHTFDKVHIERVIEIIQNWRIENNLPLYKRFYQASLHSLAKINNNQDLVYNNTTGYTDDVINSVLDANLSPKIEEVLTFEIDKNNIYETEIYKVFEASMIEVLRLKNNKSKNIGISVSGGVDSMVCTLLAYAFSNKHFYNPIVFSVNYGNRNEQNIEIYMVNKYIKFLNTIFDCCIENKNHYVRLIDEMKRIHGNTELNDRDLYEDFTRNIRFDCYKNVSNATCYSYDKNTENSTDLSFILGHNRDDSLENIISNIKKEYSYQNLFGMSLIGNEKDVTLFRPLLSVWKRDIIEFAQIFKVPFVYDSTPAWCERGKMRDVLFPFLNQFDSRILNGLFSLSTNFKEIYKVYEQSLPSITYNQTSAIVEDKEIYFEDYFKKIIQKIVTYYGIYQIRNKAIAHLVNTLKFNKNTYKITLSKQLVCIKSNCSSEFIFNIIK